MFCFPGNGEKDKMTCESELWEQRSVPGMGRLAERAPSPTWYMLSSLPSSCRLLLLFCSSSSGSASICWPLLATVKWRHQSPPHLSPFFSPRLCTSYPVVEDVLSVLSITSFASCFLHYLLSFHFCTVFSFFLVLNLEFSTDCSGSVCWMGALCEINAFRCYGNTNN